MGADTTNTDLANDAEAETRRQIVHAAGLSVDDPSAVEGLVYPIPKGVAVIRLVQSYDTKTSTGEMVRCGLCSQRQKHYSGFIVELDDGSRSIIGNECGKAHFEDWAKLQGQLSREQDTAYYDTRVAPTLAAIEACYKQTTAWEKAIEPLTAFRATLKNKFPDFDLLLRKACKQNDGHLQDDMAGAAYYTRVPDPAAFLDGSAVRKLKAAIDVLHSENNALTRSIHGSVFPPLGERERETAGAKTRRFKAPVALRVSAGGFVS